MFELKSGMKVYIRKDLIPDNAYDGMEFKDTMITGEGTVDTVVTRISDNKINYFTLEGEFFAYSYDMIDIERTIELNAKTYFSDEKEKYEHSPEKKDFVEVDLTNLPFDKKVIKAELGSILRDCYLNGLKNKKGIIFNI